MYGWLALACSFTPIIVIYSIEKKPTQSLMITTMFIGFTTMMLWRLMDFGNIVYEAGIGISCAMIYYIIWRFFLKNNLAK
jgi:hypothetical protein